MIEFRIIYPILLLYLSPYLFGFQPSQQTKVIPSNISLKLDQEKNKFHKYQINNPEKFLEKLRKELNKAKDPIKYLESLRLFASRLLVQAILVQKNADDNYIAIYIEQLKQHIDKIIEELAAKRVADNLFEIVPENDEQLAEILAHSKLLQEQELYTPEQRQVIYSWIIDPRKGKFLHLFGRHRKFVQEGFLAKKIKKETEKIFDLHANPLLHADFEYIQNVPKIIQTFSEFLTGIFENYQEFWSKIEKYQKHSKNEYMPPLITKDFDEKNKDISQLYETTSQWYQKLYSLIYQELIATLKEQRADILKNLRPLPEAAVIAKIIPSILSKELPPFIPPSQTIKLPSLDNELEKARTEWEKEQKEIAAKEVQEKAASLASVKAQRPPKKIKKSELDGSYILAGQETPIQIFIHNPKNKTTEIIFKTDKPNQIKSLPPINYTNWVKMWFENPQKALEEQGYTTFGSPKFEPLKDRWKPIAWHSFSTLIDEYIPAWGTQSEINSRRVPGKKDILITIPGQIIYRADDKELSKTGVYTYIIDSQNGQWYHRMFTPEDKKQLIEDFISKGYFSPQMTGYYDVFSPPLPGK